MKFTAAGLNGVWIIEPEPRCNEREFLALTYCEKFEARGLNTHCARQIHTLSVAQGSLQDMLWDAKMEPEVILVRCVGGRGLDAMVDLRPESTTLRPCWPVEPSPKNWCALHIPAEFAQGFQSVEKNGELLSLLAEFFDSSLTRGLDCLDLHGRISGPQPFTTGRHPSSGG